MLYHYHSHIARIWDCYRNRRNTPFPSLVKVFPLAEAVTRNKIGIRRGGIRSRIKDKGESNQPLRFMLGATYQPMKTYPFLIYLWSVHIETQVDNALPFLDVLVIREPRVHLLIKSLKTHIDRYLLANSHHHPTQKYITLLKNLPSWRP